MTILRWPPIVWQEIEGGFVVAQGGKIIAELPLPVAGLMALDSYEEVHRRLVALRRGGKNRWASLWKSRSCNWPSSHCRLFRT